jgi:hypothetical protein
MHQRRTVARNERINTSGSSRFSGMSRFITVCVACDELDNRLGNNELGQRIESMNSERAENVAFVVACAGMSRRPKHRPANGNRLGRLATRSIRETGVGFRYNAGNYGKDIICGW